jgi:arylsulfatase A-like enzyme
MIVGADHARDRRLVLLAVAIAICLCPLQGCRHGAGTVVEAGIGTATYTRVTPTPRPNILLIVADDVGYSDLGFQGSEIPTPNLDALAQGGVRFSQFYASPMCSTTRSMLLTGVDNHLAGFGNLVERLSDNQKEQPGYEGRLNERVVTLAEILQQQGYRTYLSGKWHLGKGNGAAPQERGFDRSFALLESGAGQFSNMLPLLGPGVAEYMEDGVLLESLPEHFYASESYVQKLLGYLQQDGQGDKPFFAYLAFTAAHFPLQAKAESIARNRGNYDAGYEAIHAARLQRLQDLGLAAAGGTEFPQLDKEPSWSELTDEQRQVEARRMEIYAAMIADMDTQVGVLIDLLKSSGQYDNTLIVFLSDNGAEGHYLKWGLDPLVPWAASCCDNSLDNMGAADSYLMLGPSWARVAMAPFRMFKGFTSEGGIRVPAFVHFPARFDGGRNSNALLHVTDIVPTVLEVAGVAAPNGQFGGRPIEAIQGKSVLPLLEGRVEEARGEDDYLGWEVFGKRAIRQGDWKIVWEAPFTSWWDSESLGISRNRWQLYNLAQDPAELRDQSAAEPERLAEMIQLWDEYARQNGVIIPDRQRAY